ncbi:MAG: alanine racemase [Candidatus Scalindua rubra]|uniref:Alanine racemase n=1 Tax=Candidatus Scalindua brodae TaxID=237368 RepID=A0A0B0EB34_9BACT|nr:MAG: alanine racemase [Candidatus Scalindua brodae]MBZ0107418.1 alanine racemase [Candidatus Scalindua rubra]TWU32729.1 Alanine racemase [Candidatus Brocadiaceae bacterium S225]
MSVITWIEVDLNAIEHNLKTIKGVVGSETKILAIVKADAYGHGAVKVSQTLEQNGTDMLGVAFSWEGIELRKNNINIPILILNPVLSEQIEDVVQHSLSVTVNSLDIANEISITAKKYHRNIRIHVEIDTGMGGAGVCPDKALHFIKALLLIENLEIEGVFTHFNSSEEEDKSFTYEQNRKFKEVIKQLENEKISIPLIHAANSAAILDIPDSYFNMVRPGLILYGIFPSKYVLRNIELKQAMSFKTRIINLKQLDTGSVIGYGRTFEILQQTTVAIIPVGYKDGFSRCFSSLGKVLIHGKRVPIIGRVCMDRCFIDVTSLPDVEIGSEVTLLGNQGNETISIESAAELIGTIPYEVVCNVGTKTPRKMYKPTKKK